MPLCNDFLVKDDIVLYKHKIIIPKALRHHRVISLAHKGHQGIVKTKQCLRSKVWWPTLNNDAEKFIKHCHACQVVGPVNNPVPLSVTKIPNRSWLSIGCDLCGPFSTGENLLVCVDYHNRYPEVEFLHQTSAKVITTKLWKLFCRYGAPQEIVTDSGSAIHQLRILRSHE